MFNKLLSTLPYNPSAIDEISFYIYRLKKEEPIRRVGFVLIALSMFIQIFATAVPPQKSMAASNNDIIRGGIQNKTELLRYWDKPGSDIPAIFGKFGVTRADLADLPSKPNVTITSSKLDFWSIGRTSLSGYSNIDDKYKDSEVRLKAGGTTFYMRKLNSWGVATYPAFKGTVKATGKQFWIIADCGNFVQLGKETPKKPSLEIKKSVVGGKTTVKSNESFTYRVEYRNKQDDSLAEGVVLTDDLDAGYVNRLSPTNIPMGGNGVMKKNIGNMPSTDNSRIFDVSVQVKPNTAPGTKICNIAKLTADNATGVSSSKVCVTVVGETPPPPVTPNVPIAPTTPKEPTCPDGRPLPADKNCSPPKEPEKPVEPELPPGSTKTVKNITQNLEGNDAIDSVVRAGDIIEYTLITANSNSKDKKGFDVVDYVGDVLEYTDLDLNFLSAQGGTFNDTTKQVVWSNQTLPAHGQLEKRFRVVAKNPIPSTNSPTPASTSYDCKISNKYGDEISMTVECPVMKTVEELPNTGPGTTVAIAFTVTTISGYFLARNNLLAKELKIVKKNYIAAAGV